MSSGYFSPEDRRPPITPNLAVRVATLGFIALALFSIIFFRLWFLQVLAGDTYLSQANSNRVRNIAIPAPRGDIVDRKGNVIVDSHLANVVQLDPRSLPAAEKTAAAVWGQRASRLALTWRSQQAKLTARQRARQPKADRSAPLPPIPAASPDLVRRFTALGRVIDLSPDTVQRRVIHSLAILPFGSVALRVDVPRSIIQFLEERKADYPGVVPDTIYLRRYPQTTLAAQLLGSVGEVDPAQLKRKRFRGVAPGTIVGKGGIEATYDQYLRGTDGVRRVSVDSLGNFVGEVSSARQLPQKGRQVKLSLDLGLQQEGQRALVRAIAQGRANGHPATAGAFVAMNPVSGEVYAMGSVPSFDPTVFTKPLSDAEYKALIDPSHGAPLYDRAVAGLYPTGSTFKPITALAAVGAGKITPASQFGDTNGCIDVGGVQRCNALHASLGTVDLANALRVSSDTYFYKVGLLTNSRRTEIIQSLARKLGLGRSTGIDLPDEPNPPGLVPDWQWREAIGQAEVRCRKRHHLPLGEAATLYAGQHGCGLSDMRPWSEGDNVNLAVGQGDVQASPLQMAVAYAGIAENGRIPTPHLGLEVDGSDGRFLQRISTPAARHVRLDPGGLAAVTSGLHAAASAAGGTSTAIWSGGQHPWPQDRLPVYGKTGTAQTFPNNVEQDQSWYVCWIRDTAKPNDPGLVIAVTVEKGGFGAEVAAPAARLIASHWFGLPGEWVVGSSQTR